jgi:glucose repression mediator protein
MTTNNFGKAYEAYQQAVYRDGKNPAFWCSIGVLYYNINQYHDALDAYSRAIRIHPYLAEVWYNLGALYEACNDQMTDAIDAYQRTLQLDPSNLVVAQRLNEIRDHQTSGLPLSPPPPPKDISPSSMSWSYATNSGGAPTQLAQAGLGPELSPSMGPPPPSSAVQARVPTSGSGGSPHGNAQSRFDGMSAGSRPRSTDPYRRSAIQHSPSGYPPAGNSPRHVAALAPGHRLPPYKDGRLQPNGRLGSPPSPRSRAPDGHLAGPSGSSYPFPSHLSGGSVQGRESSHDGMDWERSRNGLRNGSAAPGSRGSNLHPPTLGQPPSYPPPSHPHQHPHAPPQPYGQAARSSHVHSAVGQHGPNGGHYERAGPSAAAAGARPPFFDNPSPGPYGAYPPAGTSAAAEEFARRRSSGSTNGSHRDSKPSIPSLDSAIAAPSAPSPATPVTAPPTKGRGSRKKADGGGAEGPKKGGRRGKAAANAAAASAGDSADGSASGANTPKKRRAKAAPKAAQKEQAPAAQGKDEEAAATALAASPLPARAAPAPSTVNDGAAAAAPQREVDEEYDEGVDALMSLGGGARSEASPPARAGPMAEEAESTTAPTPANSRKRSLPVDVPSPAVVGGDAAQAKPDDESSEPDAKRARPDPAVPQPDSESVPPPPPPPPAPHQDDRNEGALGPALTEKANLSADATEETQARKEAATEAAAAASAAEPKQDSTGESAASAPREDDKENVGESTTPDKDKLPVVADVVPAEVATTEAGTSKEEVGEVVAAAEAVPVDAAATATATAA